LRISRTFTYQNEKKEKKKIFGPLGGSGNKGFYYFFPTNFFLYPKKNVLFTHGPKSLGQRDL
jgi:hypothetical protein